MINRKEKNQIVSSFYFLLSKSCLCSFQRKNISPKFQKKMVLVLVIGDTHIPAKASAIPQKFQTLLKPGKIQHVLSTGNLTCQATLDYLNTLPSGQVHSVLGDMDIDTMNTAPDKLIVTIGDIKIGLIHGHQIIPWSDDDSLETYRRKLNVDILVTGHSHECKVEIRKDGGEKLENMNGITPKDTASVGFYINPGSATGAGNGYSGEKNQPSFCLLDIQQNSCITYIYKLKGNDEVAVEKVEYKKPLEVIC